MWTKRILVIMIAFIMIGTFAFAGGDKERDDLASTEEQYPSKSILLIVPYGAGGGSDTIARFMAQVAEKYLGQKLIVENRGGGNTIPGTAVVAAAEKDGYTILLNNNTSVTAAPQVYNAPFDPLTDLIPIATPGLCPNIIAAGVAAPVKTAEEFIKYAKENPGEITISCTGYADSTGLTIFKMMEEFGIELEVIPFTSGAEQTAALLGGHVMYSCMAGSNAAPHFKEGTVVPIIETSALKNEAYNIPTFADLGYPNARTPISRTFYVPAGTPDDRIAILKEGFSKIFEDPFVKEKFEGIFEPTDDYIVDAKTLIGMHENDIASQGRIIKKLNLRNQ